MDWHEHCRSMHRSGIEQRAADKFSTGTFPFTLQVFDREEHCTHHCLIEGLGPEGRVYILKKAFEMRQNGCPAALFQSDVCELKNEEFSAHFGLTYEIDSEEWHKERHRIIHAFGGRYSNLPRHTWRDAILTGIKGPEIAPLMLRTRYIGDAQDNVVLEETGDDLNSNWYMLPDWWGKG